MVFRTDPGSKLDAATAGATVAFEVDADDERDRSGWSVVVRGRAGEVSDAPTSNACAPCRCTRGRPAPTPRYVRIRPASVTGRRIALPADLPFTWWG